MLRHRRLRFRGGVAAVEFALVLPVVLFCLFIPMIEFGRAMMLSNILAGAAEVGCRTGTLPHSDTNAIQTAINNNLASQGIHGATATVKVNGQTLDANTAVQGDSITVTVSISYSNASWLPLSLVKFLGGSTFSCAQVMRRE